jgi:probable H4MPT-linked C1 transfer pathway protein
MKHSGVIGWDIGGVNTKVACVRGGVVVAAHAQPYEIQRDPRALAPLLRALAEQIGASDSDAHAVTMTAELSQMFRTKRDGVAFVLDAVSTAFPSSDIQVYAVDGRFLHPDLAVQESLAIAASNWSATANVVARDHPDAILIDIGTTTTDIIPIAHGAVAALGATDPARLASGELVYTGALRTPVEAIIQRVPLGGSFARVSAESFVLVGDVHLWRGDVSPDDYSVATPDGRPATREFAGERIARVVCADREMLDDRAISLIADAVAQAQVDLISEAIRQVRRRHPALHTAVITGLGTFLAARAAHQSGLAVTHLADALGLGGSRCAPAAAVALLLDEPELSNKRRTAGTIPNEAAPVVDTVYKVGGSLIALPEALDATLDTIIHAAGEARVLIVPGGGPFADAVREADRELGLSDDAAHWMAVLAMDQYAHLLVGRRHDLALAFSANDVDAAIRADRIPVIAPYRWLHDADPLPHSWQVTSDSISAWFASILGASHLVLVKPPGADLDCAVDPYFSSALSQRVSHQIVHAAAATSASLIEQAIAKT